MIRTFRQRSQHKQWAGLNTEIAPDELLHVEGAQKQALEVGRNRLVLTGIIFVLAFSVIGLRLGELTLSRNGGEDEMQSDTPEADKTATDADRRMLRGHGLGRDFMPLMQPEPAQQNPANK